VSCGCDTGWDLFKDRAVNTPLKWAGLEARFLPKNVPGHPVGESPELRRELFYGGFDWDGGDAIAIFSPSNHQPQAQCWYSNSYACKQRTILGARLDRHETYDGNFRAWHWRLGAEQLAFSHQQNRVYGGATDPLYQHNTKPTLLFTGYDDVCASLGENARDVTTKMTNTPGFARFLNGTGHSLDNEHPEYIAREITQFLNSRDGAMSTEPSTNRGGGDYMNFASTGFEQCRSICSEQAQCRAYTYVKGASNGGPGTCWLKAAANPGHPDANCTAGMKE
jgi:hypothetical protein